MVVYLFEVNKDQFHPQEKNMQLLGIEVPSK